VVDSLRPGRSSASASPHASGYSTPNVGINPPPTPPHQLQPNVTVPVSSPLYSATPPLEPDSAQPATSSSSAVHTTPAYARPSIPPSALATTGSVIHDILTTIRDASDMCLPLKAAVVGVLKIWDVCEVCSPATAVAHSTNSHLVAHRAAQPRIHHAQGETRTTLEDHIYTPKRNWVERQLAQTTRGGGDVCVAEFMVEKRRANSYQGPARPRRCCPSEARPWPHVPDASIRQRH